MCFCQKGVVGTTILVEDLFYNMPTRLKSFKQPNEEYNRILDVIIRYAIHYGDQHVGFTCKKHGVGVADFHVSSTAASTLSCIRIAFGNTLSRELLPFESSSSATGVETSDSVSSASSPCTDGNLLDSDDVSTHYYTAKGFVSNANYSAKKSIFILFINDRLVDVSVMPEKICVLSIS